MNKMNDNQTTTYFLQKIAIDEPNQNCAEVWNQLVICPATLTDDEYSRLTNFNYLSTIMSTTQKICTDIAVIAQNKNESEKEFLLRAKNSGIEPSFTLYLKRDINWMYSPVKLEMLV